MAASSTAYAEAPRPASENSAGKVAFSVFSF